VGTAVREGPEVPGQCQAGRYRLHLLRFAPEPKRHLEIFAFRQ
jgi:hypothetical protein